MLHSRFMYGLQKDGFIKMIQEDGFNGIADIIWVEDTKTM